MQRRRGYLGRLKHNCTRCSDCRRSLCLGLVPWAAFGRAMLFCRTTGIRCSETKLYPNEIDPHRCLIPLDPLSPERSLSPPLTGYHSPAPRRPPQPRSSLATQAPPPSPSWLISLPAPQSRALVTPYAQTLAPPPAGRRQRRISPTTRGCCSSTNSYAERKAPLIGGAVRQQVGRPPARIRRATAGQPVACR
jgi:hypothetical protein